MPSPVSPHSLDGVYDAVAGLVAEFGYAPSVRQVADAADMASPATAHKWLHRLRDAGLVDFDDNIPRSLRLTDRRPSL